MFRVQRTCSALPQHHPSVQRALVEQQQQQELMCVSGQRRLQLQRLVAEAAKNDWVTFHAAFPYSVVTHDDTFGASACNSPSSSCAPSSSSSEASTSRAGSPVTSPRQPQQPAVVVTPEKQGKILTSLQRFHRTYWEHVMKDAMDAFDNCIRHHHHQLLPHITCDGVVPPSAAVEEAAYQQAMMRLSRRRMWRSPVTTCLERRNFADFIKENETALENPTKLLWQQQNAQRELLSTIPRGSLFANSTAMPLACS